MHRVPPEGHVAKRSFGHNAARASGAVALSLGILAGPLAIAAQASVAPHQTTTAATPSIYVPITPIRVEDTRTGSALPGAGDQLSAGGKLHVLVAGTGALDKVPADATAVVANVTAVGPSAAGFFSVYPTGDEPSPLTSNLNFQAHENDANLVTVPIASNGEITIFNHAGTANALVDVYGYYTSASTTSPSGLYTPVSPYRALGSLDVGASIGAGATVSVPVTGGATGVPTNASAVVVNVTAAHATAASFLSAYGAPVLTAEPTFSTVNFTPGPQAVANRATVPVGANGDIEVYNHAGSVDVDVDIDGYYSASGSSFVPLSTPYRVTDTRSFTNGQPIAALGHEAFDLSAAGSPVPATASAVAANFTAVSGDASGYLTVYPLSDTTNPVASDINWMANEAVPNFTIADTNGTGSVDVYASHGTAVNLVIDEFGYFVTPTSVPSGSVGTVNITVPSTTAAVGTAIPDNGTSTETVTATVTDGATGATVSGDTVLFSVAPTGSATGACGTLSPTTASTSSSGVATTTYTAPAYAPGNTSPECTVTATDADYGQTGTATIDQIAPSNSVAVTATPASLAANGTATSTLSATVTPVSAGSADNDTVSFAGVGTPSSACGTIGTPSGTTGAAGTTPVTATYTASSTAGFCTVTATEKTDGSTASVVIDQTSSPAIVAPTVTVTPTSSSVTTGATDSVGVTVESAGSPVVGDELSATISGTSCSDATISPATAVTTSSGATFTYTAGASPATCTLSVVEADAGATGSATIAQTAPASTVAVTAASSTVGPGLTDAITVTPSNPPATDAGSTVTFSVTPVTSGFTGCGTISSATAATSAPYGASSLYTAGSAAGFCTITATEGGVSGTITLDQT